MSDVDDVMIECNDEFPNSYSSPHTVKVIELKKITWMIHVAHMRVKCTQNFYRKISGKRSLGRPSCRKHKVKEIIKKYYVRLWSGFMWFRKGKGGGHSEHGNVLFRFIKCREFLDYISKY